MKLVISMNYYIVKKNEWPCKSIIVTFSQRFMNSRLKCFYALNFNISKTLKKYAFKTLIEISLIKDISYYYKFD